MDKSKLPTQLRQGDVIRKLLSSQLHNTSCLALGDATSLKLELLTSIALGLAKCLAFLTYGKAQFPPPPRIQTMIYKKLLMPLWVLLKAGLFNNLV